MQPSSCFRTRGFKTQLRESHKTAPTCNLLDRQRKITIPNKGFAARQELCGRTSSIFCLDACTYPSSLSSACLICPIDLQRPTRKSNSQKVTFHSVLESCRVLIRMVKSQSTYVISSLRDFHSVANIQTSSVKFSATAIEIPIIQANFVVRKFGNCHLECKR